MADFKVTPAAVTEAGNKFSSIQNILARYDDEVRNVAKALNFKIASTRAMRSKINTIAKNIDLCSVRAKDMSNAATNIANAYTRTENAVKNIRVQDLIEIIDNMNSSRRHIEDKQDDIVSDFFPSWGNSLKLLSKIIKAVKGKKEGNFYGTLGDVAESLGLSASMIQYVNTLIKTFKGNYETPWEKTSAWLSLVKDSDDVGNSLYKFVRDNSNPEDGFKLYGKYGTTMTNINIVSSLMGFIGESIDVVSGASDSDNVVADLIGLAGSGAELIANAHIASKFSQMVIEEGKLVNASASELKTANAYVNIAKSVFDSVEGGVRKYGEVTADGVFDVSDAGRVGIAAGVEGLVTIVPGARIAEVVTSHLFDFDSGDLTDLIISKCEDANAHITNNALDWIDRHPGMYEYVDSIENPIYREVVQDSIRLVANVPGLDLRVDAAAGWLSKLMNRI